MILPNVTKSLFIMITATMVGHKADGNDNGLHRDHHRHVTIIYLYLSTADDISYPGGVAQHICVNLLSIDSD